MQADVTKQSFGTIFTQFVLLAALFWAGYFYSDAGPVAVPARHGGYLPGNYIGDFTSAYPVITVLASLLLLFFNAFLITKLVTQNLVYPVRTYLPCIFYLIISCGICFPGYDLAAVIAAYAAVRASGAFISSFVRKVSFGTTFRGALLIGLTPLLEPQNAIYILLVPIATMVFRRCGRETVVAVLGSLLPTFFAAYLWWAFGAEFTGVFVEIWKELTAGIPAMFTNGTPARSIDALTGLVSSPEGIARLVSLLLITATLVLSILSFFSMSSDMRTRAYKINVFSLWFLLLAALSLILPSSCCGNFPVAAIPCAIITPALFIKHRTVIPLITYILLLISLLTANILNIIS